MKKIILSILCLAMMLSMGTVAFAETNEFVLTYSNEASYEINIPEGGNINVTTGKGTITIGVTDINLESGTAVSITANSDNYEDDSWYLVNTKNSADKVAYTIGTTDGGSDIASGDEVVLAKSATSATLYVTVSDTNRIGTFTDTITFTNEIIAIEMISFTIDGANHQAERNMTWEDWCESDYNTLNLYILNSMVGDLPVSDGTTQIKEANLNVVYASDLIMANNEYILYKNLGGPIPW